jgi:hypothetical protein
MSDEQLPKPGLNVDSAIVILVLTAAAYLIAFAFDGSDSDSPVKKLTARREQWIAEKQMRSRLQDKAACSKAATLRPRIQVYERIKCGKAKCRNG